MHASAFVSLFHRLWDLRTPAPPSQHPTRSTQQPVRSSLSLSVRELHHSLSSRIFALFTVAIYLEHTHRDSPPPPRYPPAPEISPSLQARHAHAMTTHANSIEALPRHKFKKPLKLVAGSSPKTSVFEKQLGLVHTVNAGTFIFTSHKPQRRPIGSYHSPSKGFEPSSFSRTTPPASPQKSPSRSPVTKFDSPVFQEYSPDNEVCVKIPLHRVRATFRTMTGFFDSLTKEDFDGLADFLSYSAVGGFAVFGEALLNSNKQGFLILVPIVLVSVLKIVSKSHDNILVTTSIDKTLSRKRVSSDAQRLVCQVIVFLKTLLLMLASKITAAFKLQIDYTSHLEVIILLMLGCLIVAVFTSVFYNITSTPFLNSNCDDLGTLGDFDQEHSQGSSRYQRCVGDTSPLYDDEYCMLETPESL